MAIGFAGAAGATTPISGDLNMVANSTIGSLTLTDNHNVSWAAVPTTLSGAVDANLTDPLNGDNLDTHGTAVADWASADAGSVTFRDYGWDFNVPSGAISEADLIQGRGGNDWDYTFVASGNGKITMSYNVTGSGDTFGLWGWTIGFNGTGHGGPVINPFDPTTSGTFTGKLVAGQTYTISLDGNPNIQSSGTFDGSMLGLFNWQITAVPEPATWGLMIAGLGLMGGALRRRALTA
jgi:hypothetical protein